MKLIVFLLLVVYVGGAWKFWSGYQYTRFSPGFVRRLLLTLLWPPLLMVNPSYRKNFQKALQGRN